MKKNCLKCNKEFEKKNTCSKKEWANSKFCSHSCANSFNMIGTTRCIGRIPHNKGKIMLNMRNKNHPNWKGGTYKKERHSKMGRIEYKNWRTLVFKRDNYTCQMCNQTGGYLHADHIQSWADFPKLRYEVNNSRTLCRSCHYFITFKKKINNLSRWGLTNIIYKEA